MADHSFFIYRGQHKTLRFAARYATSGLPVDLTDAAIKLVIRRRVGGGKLLEKDSGDVAEAAIIAPATDGVGEFYFVPTDTDPTDPPEPEDPIEVEAACYAYDVFAYDVGDDDKRIPLVPPSRFDIRATVTEEGDWSIPEVLP